MEEKKNQCYRCLYFRYYYTKGRTKYDKTKLGHCGKNEATVGIHDGCGHYQLRTKLSYGQRFAKLRLNDLLNEITEIRKILEDADGSEE